MLLNIGEECYVFKKDIEALFSYDSLKNSRENKEALGAAEKEGTEVIRLSKTPRSVLILNEYDRHVVYFSGVTLKTLKKRMRSFKLSKNKGTVRGRIYNKSSEYLKKEKQ